MERPKKTNTSFLVLVLLFILTQTAYALSATISYDGLTGNVQGNDTKEYEDLLIENAKENAMSNSQEVSTLTASALDSSTFQATASDQYNIFGIELIPESAIYNIDEDQTVSVTQVAPLTVQFASAPTPTPTPVPEPTPEIKSVVKHVNADTLNVREEPTSGSKLVTTIKRGDKVTYYETIGEWARIVTWTDRKGYILAKYLVDSAGKVEKPVAEKPKTSRGGDKTTAAQPPTAEAQTLADEIIAYSKTLLGTPYVWAGYSSKGLDCSGFTKYVFAKFGITLPRSSYAYSGIGTKVSRSELHKGDILLWDIDKNGTVGHVGIYMGNGMFIHASSSKGKVVTRALATYGEKYLGARRVIK